MTTVKTVDGIISREVELCGPMSNNTVALFHFKNINFDFIHDEIIFEKYDNHGNKKTYKASDSEDHNNHILYRKIEQC